MKMYHWVAWHRELARKIAEGGRDDLVEKIGQVADKAPEQALDPAKLGKDPLSFFGFLRDSQSKSNGVCEIVQEVFGLEAELPDPEELGELWDIIFPSASESLSREGAMFPVGNDDLLWRLFEQARQATEDNPDIKQEDWEVAMGMDGIEVGTLTQALFLVNPNFFLPIDSAIDVCFPEGWRKEKEAKIKGSEGYEEYSTARGEIEELFPECEPYEIYTFLRWQKDKEAVNEASNFFQVGTQAHGDKRGDFWSDFKDGNCVFVGGPGGQNKENPLYPLEKPNLGDIILVRTGITSGKAIAVVLKNEYKPTGFNEERKIYVLWINKKQTNLGLKNLRPHGFCEAEKMSLDKAFEESYKASFKLIAKWRGQANEDRQQAEENTMKHPHPLNTILYGPPGTGKTYNTSHYAVAIIKGESVEDVKKDYGDEGVKKRFDGYRDNGQIEIVTFHQNYAYEDFIEGIRPVLDEDGAGDGEVKYELREGTFKRISVQADNNRKQVAKNMEQAESESEIWDIDELLQAFAISVQDETETGEGFKLFSEDDKSRATITEVSWEKEGMFASFQLGGSVKSPQKLTKKVIERDYNHFLTKENFEAKDIKPTQKSDRKQHGHALWYFLLFKRMQEFQAGWQPEPRPSEEEEGIKNYVLIIDEINRGNIAKIFGELITLIEDSRRLGRTEETEVTLPYSGKSFGVPDNLYIIGTMNTADRSIALLDTALRRRFEFKEMMPESTHPKIETNIEGVDLQKLLEKMNERIRILFDREHQIGHTYFFGVKDMKSLKKVFQNRIIPLLQEYFYDNWENINLVLNQNGFIRSKSIDKFIDSGLFKKSELIDEQGKIYEILSEDDESWNEPQSYINIYEGSNDAQSQEQNEPGNGG